MSTESHDRTMLAAIAPLREAGFAVHWLHPRQKRPIGAEWQNAPIASLEDLRRTYCAGNNLGVRLGEPSKTAAGFLHVIDLDIRIPELADEAWAKLREILPIDANFPTVASGSGGASRHVYFVADKPFRSKRLAVSDGKHRREKAGKEGWSYDWEIELFGTGKQVAMPPSIHPDTGKPYVWETEFDFEMLDFGIAPSIASSVIEALGVVEPTTFAYESREPLTFEPGQLKRDLDVIPISTLHYDDWIRLGQALHHQFGGSQEGFDLWLEYTKRSAKFTGDAQVREMRRSKWRSFGKYRGQPVTMGTIRTWAQEARAEALRDEFEDEVDGDGFDSPDTDSDSDGIDELDDLLGGEDVDDLERLLGGTSTDADNDADTFSRITEADDPNEPINWVSLLDLNEEGSIKPTVHNVRLILENDQRTKGVMQFNQFTNEVVQRNTPGTKLARKKAAKPTFQLTGDTWNINDKGNGDLWADEMDGAIRIMIEAPKTQGGYGIKVPDRDLRDAVNYVGRLNSFHPVREYLTAHTWDGKPRVERLFIDYLGAPDDVYHRNIAKLMMIGAVTRVFEPGHKFDFAVILEGVQGKRKSTFIEVLANKWFVELEGDFEDAKHMVEVMQGQWILEIPELSSFQKADVRNIKAFISRKTDKVRLAWMKRAAKYPRQCIFIGSTNDVAYLKDETGGRRFWPVSCNASEINAEKLESEIGQMWAEALHLYREMRAAKPYGTLPLYLSDADARTIAERLQESRRVETTDDVIAGQVMEWLERPVNDGGFEDKTDKPVYRNETCLAQIWTDCLGKDITQYVGTWPATLGRAMRQIPGWMNSGGLRRFGRHGVQRAFIRTKSKV